MSGVRTEKSGEVIRAPQQNGGAKAESMSLVTFTQKSSKAFADVLPKHMSADRMVRLAIGAVRSTAHLGECTLPSFAASLMACSVLGLEPNTPLGHAYLIPFKNNKLNAYECTLIIGYKGYIELMHRSGIVSDVTATPVFAGDVLKYHYGLKPDCQHFPDQENALWGTQPEKLTHTYGVVSLKDRDAPPIWRMLTRAQIEQRRRRSKAADNGPWVTDYVKMCLKTAVRELVPWVPSSAEKVILAEGYEVALERGKATEAVGMLGERAGERLDDMGVFPTNDDVNDDGEPLETTAETKSEPAQVQGSLPLDAAKRN